MTEENSKSSLHQHPMRYIAGAVGATILVSVSVAAFLLSAVTSREDAIIELLDREKVACEKKVASLEDRVKDDSVKMVDLSRKLGGAQSILAEFTNKKILNDTLICPGQGVLIFDGKAQVSYRLFSKEGPRAEINLESVGGLTIENGYFYLSGPASQDTFSVNKIKYVFNFSGFEQSGKEGCIRISIFKK